MRGVGLALRATARQLLARTLDLKAHLPELGGQIVARALHLLDAAPTLVEPLIQTGKVGTLAAQDITFAVGSVTEFFEFRIDGGKTFE